MKIFFKKGEVVPRRIIKARDSNHQKYITFGVDTCCRLDKVKRLRRSESGVVIGKQTQFRRRNMPFSFGSYSRLKAALIIKNKHFVGAYSDYAIYFI